MAFLRLKDFVNATHLPESVIVSMLSGNTIPLRIDDEGFLTLELSEQSVQKLLSELADASAPQPELHPDSLFDNQELLQLTERVIREEVGDILQQALERVREE